MARVNSESQRVRMARPYYPNLDLSVLASVKTVRQQMDMHEGYFDNLACPYDKRTKEELLVLLTPQVREVEKVVERVVEVERKVQMAERAAEGGGVGPKKVTLKTSGVDLNMVSTEIQDIRQELKDLRTDSLGLETNDKIQIIKTRAALVEKLVTMDDRVNNLKRMSLFQSVVMGILDDLMPEDRRKEFMKRIEPFAREESG